MFTVLSKLYNYSRTGNILFRTTKNYRAELQPGDMVRLPVCAFFRCEVTRSVTMDWLE